MRLSGVFEAVSILRVPASALLFAGAVCQLAADVSLPSHARAPHALDWPSAYANVLASGCYVAGSITVVGASARLLGSSVLYLIGSSLSLVQVSS